MGFLRFLRVVAFIGFAMMIGLVLWKNVPFFGLLTQAMLFNDAHSYAAAAVMILFIAYPVLFVLTILVLKITGWRVYLIFGRGEPSLWELFMQNEVRPFIRFLTDSYTTVPSSYRFPYSVDFGRSRHVVLAFIYRTVRCIIILTLIAGIYYVSLRWMSGR